MGTWPSEKWGTPCCGTRQWSLVWSPVARVGLEVHGGVRVVSSGVRGGGVGVALSFLVEGQQRHVRHLDDLRNSKKPFCDSKNPPKRPTKNSPRPQKDPCLRECSGIYGPPSAGRGLGEHTSLSAFDWTGSHGIPFRGGALAPAGKPQPLFHAGSYLTSNSINAATAPAGKPQPLFHAGS